MFLLVIVIKLKVLFHATEGPDLLCFEAGEPNIWLLAAFVCLLTRLALQWILVKGFRLFSFQLPDLKKPGIVIYCHYLPVSGLGNLRACCLPWMW